jgi:hypothetical protein
MATPLFLLLQEITRSIRNKHKNIIVLTMQVAQKMSNFDGIRSNLSRLAILYIHTWLWTSVNGLGMTPRMREEEAGVRTTAAEP